MKVLIVDDNAVQADALAEYLRLRGIDTDWSVCLVGALGHLSIKRYDVAVVDMVIPCCSSSALVNGIMKAAHAPRIVVFTGLTPDDPAIEALPPGTPVVYKPADPAEVLRAIESAARAAPSTVAYQEQA